MDMSQLTPDQQAAYDYYSNQAQNQTDASINGGGVGGTVPFSTTPAQTNNTVLSNPQSGAATPLPAVGGAPGSYASPTAPPLDTNPKTNPAVAEVGRAADATVRAQVAAANAAVGATGKPKEAAKAGGGGGGGAGESPGPANAAFGEQAILQGGAETERGLHREQESIQRQAQLEGLKSYTTAQGNAIANQWAMEAAKRTKEREDYFMQAAVKRDAALTQQANAIKDVDPSEIYGHGVAGIINGAITHWLGGFGAEPNTNTTKGINQGLGSVFQGLGAFGAGMTGGKTNFAADIIQNALKTSIESQKINIEKQWKKVTHGTELSKNEELRNQYTIQKERDLNNTYLTLAKNKVLDDAASYDNPIIMERAQGLAAAIDQKIGDNTKSTAIAMSDRYFKQEQLNIESAKIGAGHQDTAAMLAQKEEDDVRKTVTQLMSVYPGASYEQLYSMVKSKGLGGPERTSASAASNEDMEGRFKKLSGEVGYTNAITQHLPGFVAPAGNEMGIDAATLKGQLQDRLRIIIGRLGGEKGMNDQIEAVLPHAGDTDEQKAQRLESMKGLLNQAEAEKRQIKQK